MECLPTLPPHLPPTTTYTCIGLTDTLVAQLAVYNPILSVIGYARLGCGWQDAGFISCTFTVQGLPAPLTYQVGTCLSNLVGDFFTNIRLTDCVILRFFSSE